MVVDILGSPNLKPAAVIQRHLGADKEKDRKSFFFFYALFSV